MTIGQTSTRTVHSDSDVRGHTFSCIFQLIIVVGNTEGGVAQGRRTGIQTGLEEWCKICGSPLRKADKACDGTHPEPLPDSGGEFHWNRQRPSDRVLRVYCVNPFLSNVTFTSHDFHKFSCTMVWTLKFVDFYTVARASFLST